ncbi:MAG: hypothetical protein V7K77_15455 [Nostoc sp.]|uniref:hypothetical protein n=1 Tax=Nostoc sp. TaxID=1180 RepID=UPI002FFB9F33
MTIDGSLRSRSVSLRVKFRLEEAAEAATDFSPRQYKNYEFRSSTMQFFSAQ